MPGSADPDMRRRATEVYRKGIHLASDLGVGVVQVAGYYAYYEPYDPGARQRYVDTLLDAVPHAAREGIVPGIENVDGNDIASVPDVMELVELADSPWVQCHPDVGNMAGHGGESAEELRAGEGHIVAVHVKDVLPGRPRRVPFGTGIADFDSAFEELARQGWSGRIMLEMWGMTTPPIPWTGAGWQGSSSRRRSQPQDCRSSRTGIGNDAGRTTRTGVEGKPGVARQRPGRLDGRQSVGHHCRPGTHRHQTLGDALPRDEARRHGGGFHRTRHRRRSGTVLRHGLPPGHLRGPEDVGSVVHTHSRYATAFAAVGKPIPCCLTAIADEFGGPVPCGGYARIGSDAIGRELLATIGDSPAVLMRQHGVFTIGATINKTLQAAVMVEDVAHTVFAAMQLGQIEELPTAEIAANHDRYTNRYGTINASTGVSR